MGKPSRINPAHRIHRFACALLLLFALALRAFAQTQADAVPLILPSALVFDSSGNLFFAERGAHSLRKLAPDGSLITIAGTGTQGFSGDNGPAASAQLDSPSGLALDASSNLYLADTHNHRIRRIDATTHIITTIAGTGAPGFSGDNGPAGSAQLDFPTALAFDTAGNLYLADTRNHRIRRIDATTHIITTIAGTGTQGLSGDNGPATSAAIDTPSGLALDASKNLYLADTHNHRIRRIDAVTGVITTIAGTSSTALGLPTASGDNGPATSATLALPRGLTIDPAGNLYLADTANHRIRRIAPDGTITTAAGQGTEAFAGDNAPATSASLDSPRAVAISPANLLTLADTANQRIRQLDALPAPGPDIHTIAGLGVTTSSTTLTLTGPSVTAYGSGSLTATAVGATGSITFLETSTPTPLATSSLNNGVATLDISTLLAGSHTFLAAYAGDSTHSAAQSQSFTLTINPRAITATAGAVSILYGQTIPTLTGTLTGVLPRDTGSLAATFATTAAALSSVGAYPISAALTGPAAPNYTLASTIGSLTIAQAPTTTSVAISAATISPGTGVTLTIQTASSTTGTPTGSITLRDGATALATLPLTAGAASFSSTILSTGIHPLTAVYSGDLNFLPSASPAAAITVTSPSDFNFTATGATAQTIPSGSAATYTFSVGTQGAALSSPIALAITGVPLGATSSFNPAYLPPGGPAAFTLTIQTQKSLATNSNPTPSAPLAALLLAPLTLAFHRLRRRLRQSSPICNTISATLAAAACVLSVTLASGCGDRVNTGSQAQTSTTYTLTVTGTATSPAGTALQHSINITLQVLP